MTIEKKSFYRNLRNSIVFSAIFSFLLFNPAHAGDTFIMLEHLKVKLKWMTFQRYILIRDSCEKHKVEILSICALGQYESEGNSKAISEVGARGLLQVMPSNYRGNPDDLFQDEICIPRGVELYKAAKIKANGDKKETLRFYNAGPNSNRENYYAKKKNREYVNGIIALSKELSNTAWKKI